MDGFGVHTYRLVTNDVATRLVKWHWTSMQGKASSLWEEAQATGGKNADFHRQDLCNAIEAVPRVGGRFHEPSMTSRIANYLLFGVQIIDESDQLAFGFDPLDATKFVPEELVPITPLGKMTLNMNPTNYFAETGQIGVSPATRD